MRGELQGVQLLPTSMQETNWLADRDEQGIAILSQARKKSQLGRSPRNATGSDADMSLSSLPQEKYILWEV